MTPRALAILIEQRLKLKPFHLGAKYREVQLLFRDEAPELIEWLRKMDTATAFVGEK